MANDDKQQHTRNFPNVRIRDADLQEIRTRAAAAGLSFSEYVRTMCLNGTVSAPRSQADAEALRLLLAAGRNVNQLAKSGHINRTVDVVALHEALAEIRAVVARFL